jgi:hypothetical protein
VIKGSEMIGILHLEDSLMVQVVGGKPDGSGYDCVC